MINEVFTGYEACCISRKSSPLQRKTWSLQWSLQGFRSQSGGFVGLKLAGEVTENETLQAGHTITG